MPPQSARITSSRIEWYGDEHYTYQIKQQQFKNCVSHNGRCSFPSIFRYISVSVVFVSFNRKYKVCPPLAECSAVYNVHARSWEHIIWTKEIKPKEIRISFKNMVKPNMWLFPQFILHLLVVHSRTEQSRAKWMWRESPMCKITNANTIYRYCD